MRVALFGSPEFAVPTLQTLVQHHEVALVVTQPDKPVGRGLKLRSPATAHAAKELGLRLEQPKRLKRNEAFLELIESLTLDVAVTAAYGKILPQALLDVPRHGFLNVHASLLPKYRGAAPIQWALINGETETGISIMQTEAGLDTGPVRYVEKVAIGADATSLGLFSRLAEVGANTLKTALNLLAEDKLSSHPQNDAQATYAPLLSKEDGQVRWSESAARIYNRFRGVFAWPGTWTTFQGQLLKLHALSPVQVKGKPGEVLKISQAGLTVAAGEGAVLLKQVQPPNKPRMNAFDWANGHHVKVGEFLD